MLIHTARYISNFYTCALLFFVKVKMGGAVKSVTSVKECMATLEDISTDEVKTCLDVEASASVKMRISVDTAFKHCKQAKDKKLSTHSFANSFSDRFVL